MNSSSNTTYDQFATLLNGEGLASALNWLAAEYQRERQYGEWFEVLKMKARYEAGLPIIQTASDSSEDPAMQETLEKSLYRACAIVGTQLFRDGQPRNAWKFYQLVGDRRRAAELLQQIPPTAENATELIDVAIGSDVAPRYGLEIILRYRGTCDAITTMDQMIAIWPPAIRDACAAQLARHVYDELRASVATAIEQREPAPTNAGSLVEWIDSRPWLFEASAFHIDPSHLAATVRLARLTNDADALTKAGELCEYGRRLDPSLIAKGEPPFGNWFADHGLYFEGARGRDLESVLKHFSAQGGPMSSPAVKSSVSAVIADLLCCNSRWSEALDWSLEGMDGEASNGGIAPAAMEIAERCGRLPELAEWYREREKLLMYCLVLVRARQNEHQPTEPPADQ